MGIELEMKFIIMCCLICTVLNSKGSAYLKHAITIDQSKGSLCLDVGHKGGMNTIPGDPELVLVLRVNYVYAQSVAEAGNATLYKEDLLLGKHVVSYKYLVTNMTHDLQVRLNGIEKKFMKSEVPRWTSVSSFLDVSALIQGNVQVESCEDDVPVKSRVNSNDRRTTTTKDHEETTGKFFITEEKTTLKSLPDVVENIPAQTEPNFKVTKHDVSSLLSDVNDPENQEHPWYFPVELTASPENQEHFHVDLTASPENQEHFHVDLTASPDNQEHFLVDLTASPEREVVAATESLTVSLDRNDHKQLAESDVRQENYTEIGRTESVLSCDEDADCTDSQVHYNYAAIVGILGALIALVLAAVVVSLVFHRKTKKLVLARPPPDNKLHKMYESTASEESKVMLGKLECHYESDC